jgi:hypothetical protein
LRRREIDPAFFSSDEVIAVSMPARLLFIGLWTLADREGRLRDEPSRIKRHLFPDDQVDADGLLTELDRELVIRYCVDDVPCIAIPNFTKYQHVHPREASSKLPAPPASREKARQGGVKPGGLSSLRTLKPSGPSESSPHGDSSSSHSRIDVQTVWDAWTTATGRKRATLDDKRRKLIVGRLREFSVDDLVAAVRGWKHDPWPDRARQNGIHILLRDASQVEKFRDLELASVTHDMPRDSMSPIQREYTDRMAAELQERTRKREEEVRGQV